MAGSETIHVRAIHHFRLQIVEFHSAFLDTLHSCRSISIRYEAALYSYRSRALSHYIDALLHYHFVVIATNDYYIYRHGSRLALDQGHKNLCESYEMPLSRYDSAASQTVAGIVILLARSRRKGLYSL